MGLDGVELVMEFEDEFKIRISDDVASRMFTVGDVARFVTLQLRNERTKEPCSSSAKFYQVRRALMSVCSVPRATVRPDSDLRRLVPILRRRRFIKALKGGEIPPPELERHTWVVRSCMALVLTTSLAILIGGLLAGIGEVAAILAFITLWFGGMAMYFATQPIALCFAHGCETAGDLSQWLAPVASSQEIDPGVFKRVCQIVSQQLGVDVKKLMPSTDFVRDLHMDQ